MKTGSSDVQFEEWSCQLLSSYSVLFTTSFEVPAVPRCDSGRRGRIWRRGRWIRWLKEPHAAPYQLSGYLPVLVLQWPLAFALVRNLNDLSQPLQLILHEKFNSCFSADFQRSALKNRSINAATIFFFAFDFPLVWQDDARCILLNRVWKGFGNMAVRVSCVGETSIRFVHDVWCCWFSPLSLGFARAAVVSRVVLIWNTMMNLLDLWQMIQNHFESLWFRADALHGW